MFATASQPAHGADDDPRRCLALPGSCIPEIRSVYEHLGDLYNGRAANDEKCAGKDEHDHR